MTVSLWLMGMFVAGLLAGSVLNCAIWRLPVMLRRRAQSESRELLGLPQQQDDWPVRFNLFLPRSCCPHCRRAIAFYHNIPLVSWLWLRGRCHHCRQAIGCRYPLVELAAALSSGWVALIWPPGEVALALALCAWLLIALIAIDIQHMWLPDVLTLPLLWLGLLVNLNGALVPLSDAVLGAVIGYLSLWLLYWGFKLATGREGLGYGDFKLLAALGAWCGWQRLPVILLYAAMLGIVAVALLRLTGRAGRDDPLPFGPCLALSGWWMLIMSSVTW
ncbi:prepilin peptidase [Cedecea colo]|uniref:Prepilin leader peptidase/N-methyltransferase n=1 Tax=Cedecea colo TaxID=2552946 RepID=A0ABX0VJ78_9ENTR|nr:A24 family peptidase [Cedecea colo]NIY46301.1 prepilin peptidase [Cedecea colo]